LLFLHFSKIREHVRFHTQTIYVKNPRLLGVKKLFHLNSKMRGEARYIVTFSPLTKNGFEYALENLQSRFENKRLLFNNQLKNFFNLPLFPNSVAIP